MLVVNTDEELYAFFRARLDEVEAGERPGLLGELPEPEVRNWLERQRILLIHAHSARRDTTSTMENGEPIDYPDSWIRMSAFLWRDHPDWQSSWDPKP